MSTTPPNDNGNHDVARAEHRSGDVAVDDRFENPGLEPHRHRLGDSDPAAAKRSEAIVVILLVLSVIASIAGVVLYVVLPLNAEMMSVRTSNLALGLGLGIGALGIGLAAVHWAKSLMNDEEQVEERHMQASDAAGRAEAQEILRRGAADSNIARRPLLKGALAGALALAPLPFVVPLVGNLGRDWDVDKFRHTIWGDTPEEADPSFFGETADGRVGRRLAIDPTGDPLPAASVTRGSVFHIVPHGMEAEEHYYEEKAKAVVILVRMDPELLVETPERQDWSYDGIVAYSKICTHVGCPVALYEQTTHELLCPCHQSTFDMTDGAKVVFGPAKRALPQLPIAVDTEGYLIATADFDEPIGASYWERLK
ncbi:ubiquinol-cytochrome c reductase iron-sulfur subunit [Georgenia sp. Z1491]|uniref:cytochrome bc1 complex Rieske iron-sulfur subunit n=1 Tax=Georgenia sp. Z1491 TaxID=3416707 RepID=UPI003CF4CF27